MNTSGLALKHVHSANILHRDLKSQNIFLTLAGVVKLGDFGIAKVLDATDDQVMFHSLWLIQIAKRSNPRRLGLKLGLLTTFPQVKKEHFSFFKFSCGTFSTTHQKLEICESKPYGRKSDIWSLGVLLYEIIALEMPFQATSLPALVHKICSSEPSYTKLENKYSPTLLRLTKSTLSKQPDSRPTIQQIVKTDFIQGHISRLLSYTLKVGNGGVSSAAEPEPLKPEEVEKRLEEVITKQRQNSIPSVDAPKDGEKEKPSPFNREEEIRKIKKFQQDQINKKKQQEQSQQQQQQQAQQPPSQQQQQRNDVANVKPAPTYNRQPSQQDFESKAQQAPQRLEPVERSHQLNDNEGQPYPSSKQHAENSKINNVRANASAAVPVNNMEVQPRRYVGGNYNQNNNGNIISGNYNNNHNNNISNSRATNASSNGGSQYESAARR